MVAQLQLAGAGGRSGVWGGWMDASSFGEDERVMMVETQRRDAPGGAAHLAAEERRQV